jgi:tetrapyrrole methylase family protein/MazG family protein
MDELVEIIKILREKCPWDREQTHESLKPYMLEEAQEAVEAIDENDPEHLKEELGDVLLQVLVHAQIASESGQFNLEDIIKTLKEKLIYRHPHVFGDVKVQNADEVKANWEQLKKKYKRSF